MRLNLFTPLPPARTEIARHTVRLIPLLAAESELTLWTDAEEWDAELEKHAEVRSYQPGQMPWADLNRGDICVYQIGNSSIFHSAIWQVSRRHPGVVVLHDTGLHHFFVGLFWDYLERPDQYVAEMNYYYGEEGRRDAEELFRGTAHDMSYMARRYPLTRLAVEHALGVLVHTEDGFDELRQTSLCPVAHAPLPFAGEPHEARRSSSLHAATSEQGITPYRLVVFGHIGDNRRLDAVLDALAGLRTSDRFRLDVYGEILNEDYLRPKVYSLGLEARVTLHGFVADAELESALAAAHLAINLRYPSMGEASASQLRIWSYALPSLVTRVGWYATLPADAVAFVRPEAEVEDIKTHLEAFLNDPARFAAMGERGQQLLRERHTPEAYVQTLTGLAAAARSFRPRAALYNLAERAGAEMSAWAPQAESPSMVRRIARKIAVL